MFDFVLCQVNASLVTAQLYTQMTTSYWTSWHIYFGMVGMSLWSINAAIGYSKALKSIKVKPDSKKDWDWSQLNQIKVTNLTEIQSDSVIAKSETPDTQQKNKSGIP